MPYHYEADSVANEIQRLMLDRKVPGPNAYFSRRHPITNVPERALTRKTGSSAEARSLVDQMEDGRVSAPPRPLD